MNWPWSHNKHRKEEKEIIFVEQTDIIIVEDCHYKKFNPEKEELDIIEKLTKNNEKLIELVGRLAIPPAKKVKQVLVQIINNNKFIVMSVSIASNQKASITLSLVDADTLQPITATFVDETETSDNPAAATADTTNGIVGVAAGTGNITSVATWTYTDSNTQQPVTVTLTTVTPFEVTTVVTAENVSQVVTFGTPVAQ